MANEITVTCTLTCTKSGTTVTGTKSAQVTLAGTGKWSHTQAVGTSAEQIAFPADLTTEGITFLWLYNEDSTNYVEVSLDASVASPFAKIRAGHPACIPVYTGNPTYYAKANTAAVNLAMVAVGT